MESTSETLALLGVESFFITVFLSWRQRKWKKKYKKLIVIVVGG
jgi:hypothetical protein